MQGLLLEISMTYWIGSYNFQNLLKKESNNYLPLLYPLILKSENKQKTTNTQTQKKTKHPTNF